MLLIVITFVVLGLFLLIAFNRTGKVDRQWSMNRNITLPAAGDPDSVFQRILGLEGVYKVDDSDSDKRVIILSSSPTFTTWGFFYPVFIVADGDGGSKVAIGISSKLIQFGPLVTRAHKKCAETIESVFEIPAARVVNG